MTESDTTWAGIGSLAALPEWLLAAADPQRVQAALEQELAAATPSPGIVVHACRPEHFRLRTDTWAFLCPVIFGRPGDAPAQAMLEGTLRRPGQSTTTSTGGASGPSTEPNVAFAAPDWHCALADLGLDLRTAPPDDALPELPLLTDATLAQPLLEQVIRDRAGYADIRLAACRPQVMRYARGSRCTIRYDLDYPPRQARPGWPQLVVAKTYRGEKGSNAYQAMSALWDSELARSPSVAVAEPLGYLPELRVLIQGPVAGDTTLKDLIRSTLRAATPGSRQTLDDYLAKTAQGLAAMHGCGVQFGQTVTLDDEVAEIATLIERLAVPLPELSQTAMPLLRRVTEEAGRRPADPIGPSHRAFRPAQVLLCNGAVGFIDFDGFCQAEPALDVALFRAGIRDCGLTAMRPSDPAGPAQGDAPAAALAAVDALCDAFVSHYRAVAPVCDHRVKLWETLDLLTYVLHAWSKLRPGRLPPRMVALEHHLRTSGLSA